MPNRRVCDCGSYACIACFFAPVGDPEQWAPVGWADERYLHDTITIAVMSKTSLQHLHIRLVFLWLFPSLG